MKRLSQQQGVALVISLLMLVAITLLAVSTLRNSVLQEKLVSNLNDAEISHQVAEATLRQVATQLPLAAGAAGYIAALPAPVDGTADAWNRSAVWSNAGLVTVVINGVNYTGEYIVENLGYWSSRQDPSCKAKENPLCERQTFRITARNRPVTGRAGVMMQVVWRM